MVGSFLGGARDAEGRRGYVPIAQSEVVAVDLANGQVLWRRPRIGRPVAATLQRLITLDRARDRVVLRLIDASSGEEAAQIENFGMPDWVATSDLAPDLVQVDAAAVPDGIRLDWTLHRRYRGGAPPPKNPTAAAQEAVVGAAIIDPIAARAVPAEPATPATPATAEPTYEPSTDPTVVALARVSETIFALKAQGSGVTLEARDARNGAVLWEAALSSQRADGPAPLRK